MPQNNPFLPGFHHCSLIVVDTAKALLFYQGILGLQIDHNRPDLGYPGAWLVIGGGQIHLLELPDENIPVSRSQYGGRSSHLALQVKNLAVFDPFSHNLSCYFRIFTVVRYNKTKIYYKIPINF